MLSCHYIQKGGIFTRPSITTPNLISLLKTGLSTVLAHFPPLAGRLTTDTHGCARGVRRISRPPDFSRNSVLISSAVLKVPEGGPKVTFSGDEPLRERIFSFSREAILKLKAKANNRKHEDDRNVNAVELFGKQSNDTWKGVVTEESEGKKMMNWLRNAVSKQQLNNETETKLSTSKTTTFRMAVNCRHRLEPKLDPLYFGNAIQSIPTVALAGELLSRDLRWSAELLNKNVRAHDNATVRRFIEDWEKDPKCFPLGNFDGAMITMGSSPQIPLCTIMTLGGAGPLPFGAGRANKFDGKISAFPGREGGGTVDLEVVLSPDTMTGLESDPEFMNYVSFC
ncbi:hypothetical protein Ancab_034434 [Ancistrocladus abbreviatus]